MTMQENSDLQLKNEVREYWNSHPCGTQFTDLKWGSKEFFDEVERFRYATQPFMNEIVGFDKFKGKKSLRSDVDWEPIFCNLQEAAQM